MVRGAEGDRGEGTDDAGPSTVQRPDNARPSSRASRPSAGRGDMGVCEGGDNVGTLGPQRAHAVTTEIKSPMGSGSGLDAGAGSGIGAGSGSGERRLRLEFLGCSTSGDGGEVALAGEERPAMADPYDRVVGYASWALWEETGKVGEPERDGQYAEPEPSDELESAEEPESVGGAETTEKAAGATALGAAVPGREHECGHEHEHEGSVLLRLARTALAEHLGIDVDGPSVAEIRAAHPWLDEPGASFVTLTENGRLRGCIGSLRASQSLGADVAEHAVDAAVHDPRFYPVGPGEYPLLRFEVSVLGEPEPMVGVRSRDALERALKPGVDGLIISDGVGRAATFLPQVWDELPDPHEFVGHLLAKAGLPANMDWRNGEITARRYTVRAYR
ncbi:AmmeMemoRadiSam system protein A [Bifidobacterium avesanii]|uniref:AmmeMemoRadiSam system protein A n=2 Tax=Bifidobacterium avesanii TaxID=1798157 RepID=A0A7K3TFH4_9BIFI|nr:AmmeMemoRadiSam system protein A [Bifidobacterium avesanii]